MEERINEVIRQYQEGAINFAEMMNGFVREMVRGGYLTLVEKEENNG